ncbi:hypothetical protein JX265_001149 [Neoarthrinium moseri]|uniref:Heterokaryon incompatibility domain-containing protein n=1 Tax=Neoarthrinium moseri TaxID=1658444 RepID=A0A9P9WXN8_9PEZI|nr:uncharacterized protein JN550_007323 [Neoarthrinium moseri]KAI1866776.1 hypothetical protein JN550_007323 [Neoarthrinium moseri]KAI1880909.1 hypothetical protein JX265_001149 [Neoarthrinium moseri]
MATDSGYEYTDLDWSSRQIRLLQLRLQAGDIDSNDMSEIDCSLQTFQLADSPPFYALSYVWGTDKPAHKISINKQPFLIRSNLWVALQELYKHISRPATAKSREKTISLEQDKLWTIDEITKKADGQRGRNENGRKVEYLWVDAICINQRDPLERGHQVDMMRDIFLAADFVLSWLGLEEHGSERAIEALIDVAEGRGDNICDEALQSILTLCRRSYFERMWIVQEFILARSLFVLCGHRIFCWDDLDEVFLPPGKPYTVGLRLVQDISIRRVMRKIWGDAFEASTLYHLLSSFHGNKCSDPRDRVYALLGLISSRGGFFEPLAANYEITTRQLFCRVFRHLRIGIIGEQMGDFKRVLRMALQIPEEDGVLLDAVIWASEDYNPEIIIGGRTYWSLDRLELYKLHIEYTAQVDKAIKRFPELGEELRTSPGEA